jgi:ParB-like chromosome segregation protein Spo0J
MDVEWIDRARLRPYPENPRVNKGAVAAVRESIRLFGWRQPIVAGEDLTIIIGHTRWLASDDDSLPRFPSVPVLVAKDLDPERVRALRIADNKTADIAEWDMDKLAAELRSMSAGAIDWIALGFKEVEISDLLGTAEGAEWPGLREGDREPFQQMTFVLHDSQVEVVKEAVRQALDLEYTRAANENRNGNALARIASRFLGREDKW